MSYGSARLPVQQFEALLEEQASGALTDRQLLRRFITVGDEAAFASLVRRHGPLVLGVCRRVLHDSHAAEDAFQATFLVLARKAGSVRKPESLGSWLYGVAYRLAKRMKAGAAPRPSWELGRTAAPAYDPADHVSWGELRSALDDELNRLPEKYRTPLLLCYLEGLTQDEAAGRLGWPRGTLKRRLERGRDLLRTALTRRGLTLSAGLFGSALAGGAASAALPPAQLAVTVRSAVTFTTNPAAVALASPTVAILAQGVVRSMFLSKLKIGAALMLTAAALMGGTGLLAHRALADREPEVRSTTENEPPSPGAGQQPGAAADDTPLPAGAVARFGTARFRHDHGVTTVAYSPDGLLIASGTYRGTVYLWEARTGRQVRLLTGHSGPVYGLTFSRDGKGLATAGHDAAIRLWDVASGRLRWRSEGHQGAAKALAFSPDGKTLASGGQDHTIRLWNAFNGPPVRTLEGHDGYVHGLAFAPDGRTLVSASEDKTLKVWDFETGKELRSLVGHKGNVTSVAVSPDGRTLASASWDTTVRLWDAATGEEQRVLRGHSGGLESLAFSPDGSKLASAGGSDGSVRRWDVATGRDLPPPGQHPAQALALAVAYSPDGKTIASAGGDNAVRLWDAATGRELFPPVGHQGSAHRLAFLADGKTLVSTGHDRTVRLWDATTGREVRELRGHADGVWPVAVSPDGQTLATGSRDGVVCLWELAAGREAARLQVQGNVRSLAFAPDGKTLAVGCGDDRFRFSDKPAKPGELSLWHLAPRKKLWDKPGAHDGCKAVVFSPDGKQLATAGNDGRVRLWRAASGEEARTLEDHRGSVEAVAFSPDGELLASGGQDGQVRLWSISRAEKVRQFGGPTGWITSVVFSADGRSLAVATLDAPGLNFPLRIWEVATGQERARFTGHQETAFSAIFSPDGRLLVSSGADTTLLSWDLTGRMREGRLALADLTDPQLETEWIDLASEDAARAYRAVWALVAAPKQAVPLVRKTVTAVPKPDTNELDRLIADLDSDTFAVREKATAELEKLGEAAEAALQRAHADSSSAEVRTRAKRLLDKLGGQGPSAEGLRRLRAVEVLEHIGTPEVRQCLEVIAQGAPQARLTQEAKRAAERLAKRPTAR